MSIAVSPPLPVPPVATPPGQGVELKVTNLLAEARGPETVAVKLRELMRIWPTIEPSHAVIVDSAGNSQLSQWVDTNGDESPDELVFQANFGARETKTFRVQAGTRRTFQVSDFKVYGRFVRERHDDFAFENDRVAHRMYGPALETWRQEPLTSSGIDVWAKRTRRLVINDWYLTDDYHRDNGDGADLYSVNKARGCGGLGIWSAGKLWLSRNFIETRVLANGPLRGIFELEYPPYEVDGSRVAETKRITVDAGRNLNRFESYFKVLSGERPKSVGLGIAKHPGGTASFAASLGLLKSWEPLKGENGSLGCAVLALPEAVEGEQSTELDTLLLTRMPALGPLIYYAGFGWDKSQDFADEKAWTAYAEGFARALRSPLRVSLGSAAPSSLDAETSARGWATRSCDWLMQAQPQGLGEAWEYDAALVLRGCEQLGLLTGDARYLAYVKKSMDSLLDAEGAIRGYDPRASALDDINPGKLLFRLYAGARDTKAKARYRKALVALRNQLKAQPRTSEGGFWHKRIYPSQMWLDGLYMAAPFMAQFAATFDEPALRDDVVKQVTLMERHLRDPKTGLLYHGWDETKQERWANRVTGASPEFWGRALGWYAMALVDVLEYLPESYSGRAVVLGALQRVAKAVAAAQDPARGVWWQVLDKPELPGNYREASASAMFSYVFSKALRHGWLAEDQYGAVAERAYRGVVDEFVRADADGNLELRSVCKVAGLGGNPYRDGSYGYYVGTDVASNDPKGFGAFILASVERL